MRHIMLDRVLLMPSFSTGGDIEYRPLSWFDMGPRTNRMTCELVARLRADGQERPVLVVNPASYNGSLGFSLSINSNLPRIVIPDVATAESVAAIVSANADAYVLAGYPATAASLFNALLASGAVGDPTRWYLSPTLHSPAFLSSISRDALQGVRGVAASKGPSAEAFQARFRQRWHDEPLDDASSFYHAGALAALALVRAQTREGTVPGADLRAHVVAVTGAGGHPVRWDQIGEGMDRLRQGQEIEYVA